MLEKLGITPRVLITFIGACIVKFSTSVITTWGNINLYILSHFYHEGKHITEKTNPTILLITVFPMIFATLAATRLCHKYGHQNVIKACGIVFFFSPLISSFFFKFQVFVVFSIIIPASSFAIIAIPILNTMWGLIPDSRNLITAVLVVCYGIGSLVWNLLFMHMINPNNEAASIKEGDMSFFPQTVSNNVHKSVIIGFLLSGFLTIIGVLMIKREKFEENRGEELNEQVKEGKIKNKEKNQQELDTAKSEDEMIQNLKKPEVTQALRDSRFIIIFLISFFISLYEIHLIMNLKIIFMPIVNDDHFLGYVSILCNVISIGGAFLWGLIGDKKGIAFSLLLLVTVDFFVKIYSNFAVAKPTIVVMMILIGILSKAMATLAGPGFVQYFGLEIGTELLPYKAVAILAGFILVPLFQVITASFMTPHQYLMALSIFSLLTLILGVKLYNMKKKNPEECAPK